MPVLYIMWQPAIQWSDETFKLLHHMETKHPALKDKPLEFLKKKKNMKNRAVIEDHYFIKYVCTESIVLNG